MTSFRRLPSGTLGCFDIHESARSKASSFLAPTAFFRCCSLRYHFHSLASPKASSAPPKMPPAMPPTSTPTSVPPPAVPIPSASSPSETVTSSVLTVGSLLAWIATPSSAESWATEVARIVD